MTTNETCNGYTNYSTFLMALYMNNERAPYEYIQHRIGMMAAIGATHIDANKARHMAESSGALTIVKGAESGFIIGNVDWDDIAEGLRTDLEEYERYN
jgi:hypothetical protein